MKWSFRLLLMSKEIFFLCEPVEFKPGIKVYPPTVKEVVVNNFYNAYCKVLTYSQEEIEDEFIENNQELSEYPTPLEFLLNNSYHNEDYKKIVQGAFEFFIHSPVSFLYEQKMIIIGTLETALKEAKTIEDLIVLNEENFFDFQNLIRESIGKKPAEKPKPNEHPKIKEMKRKARYRDRVKAKQAAKSKDGVSLFASLVSICCMGVGITPLNIGEMSYVAIESILRKYQEKEKYDIDIRSLLAGADSKKIKPKYWIRNFEE